MKVLRPTELAAMLGVTIQTIGRWRRRGALPDPRLIGPNVLGWLEEDIEQWLRERPQVKAITAAGPEAMKRQRAQMKVVGGRGVAE